jgi:hypothetical protein
MIRGAAHTPIPNGCREQLASAIATDIPGFARTLHESPTPADLKRTYDPFPHKVTTDDVQASLKEIAHDPKALSEVMAGLGTWVGNSYDGLVKSMGTDGAVDMDAFKNESIQMGDTFCALLTAVRDAGKQDRDKALATLASFRFGVNIVFDVAKHVPVVGEISGDLAKIPGGVSGKAEDNLKDSVAAWMSGVDKETEGLKSKKKSQDELNALNGLLFDKSMSALGKDQLLLYKLMEEQGRLAAKDPGHQKQPEWPPFMFRGGKSPSIPMEPPPEAGFLTDLLDPKYVGPDGSIVFPGPGDENYSNYRGWCNAGWNRVAERAHTMSDGASEQMHQCMTDKQWVESS